MNLLTEAKSHLNPDSLPSLSDLLGIEASALPTLIEEALPALLAIFQTSSANPTKAPLINQFLGEIGPDLLENPDELISSQGKELMKAGKGALAKLLGPQLTDYIAPIAKTTGLGEGKVASGLGALAPFVTALLSGKANRAEELQAVFAGETLAVAEPEAKARPKAEVVEKSYLPDPDKKKERRPFPKRKAILVVLILALIAAAAFYVMTLSKSYPETEEDLETPERMETSSLFLTAPSWDLAA